MPGKKNIILIGSIPPPYHGSSIYFNNLLNSRLKDEFNITHLDISDHRNLDNLSRLDLTNVKLALGSIRSLYRKLKISKPDLIYIPVASNFLPYLRDGLFILTSSYFSKAKIVIHLHEGDYFRTGFYSTANFLLRYFIRKTLSKVHTAIVLGDRLKSVFKDLVKNVVACPNGIDNQSGEIRIRQQLLSKDKIVISFLGNLFESKGVLDVLNAAETVLKKYNNAEFRFAGAWSTKEGDTEGKAMKIIKEKKLRDSVRFPGVITGKDKDNFLEETDIFVFPTWYNHEGFPLVIIEAMAAGCPVISTKDTGAIPDIIVGGESGILVDKKAPPEIAAAIMILIENPALKKRIEEKGFERYVMNYTLDISIDKIISIFNKVLN